MLVKIKIPYFPNYTVLRVTEDFEKTSQLDGHCWIKIGLKKDHDKHVFVFFKESNSDLENEYDVLDMYVSVKRWGIKEYVSPIIRYISIVLNMNNYKTWKDISKEFHKIMCRTSSSCQMYDIKTPPKRFMEVIRRIDFDCPNNKTK